VCLGIYCGRAVMSADAIGFGVRASSAIYQRTMERVQGNATSTTVGSYSRSMHMERHAGAIRALVDETPCISLKELRTVSAPEPSGKLWRTVAFFSQP
jgi:hypothetical protein